jgi:hypothetical protein
MTKPLLTRVSKGRLMDLVGLVCISHLHTVTRAGRVTAKVKQPCSQSRGAGRAPGYGHCFGTAGPGVACSRKLRISPTALSTTHAQNMPPRFARSRSLPVAPLLHSVRQYSRAKPPTRLVEIPGWLKATGTVGSVGERPPFAELKDHNRVERGRLGVKIQPVTEEVAAAPY